MDGLLVDTEPLWSAAQLDLAASLGAVWRPEIKAAVVGTRLDAAVPVMLRGLGHPPTADLVESTTDWLLRRMLELYQGGRLELLPGAGDLLAAVQDARVPTALVSSSYRVLVDAVVRSLGLAFDVVLGGDEVTRAKPDAEPYRTACVRLGVSPEAAVVLEDSPAGVQSAQSAGCAVVAVPNVAGVSLRPQRRRSVVASLEDVQLADLDALVRTP